MSGHRKNRALPSRNSHSNDITSRISGLTESKLQGSDDWRGRNPPLPAVDMTALCQIQHAEETNMKELQ
jgi:hypothetical protein